MNSKKAKQLRRSLSLRSDLIQETRYVESTHPKEREHVKVYPKKVLDEVTGAEKVEPYKVKVKTLKLDKGCARHAYQQAKHTS